MNQYPGGQQPQDPYYGQRAGDPYAPPPPAPPSDPYFGQGVDPYAPPPDPYAAPPDSAYAQQQAAWYAQQQAWYAQQRAAQTYPQADEAGRGRGGAGAAIVGLLLVFVGAWILFGDQIDLDFGQLWPIAAVALGTVMVVAAFIPRRRA